MHIPGIYCRTLNIQEHFIFARWSFIAKIKGREKKGQEHKGFCNIYYGIKIIVLMQCLPVSLEPTKTRNILSRSYSVEAYPTYKGYTINLLPFRVFRFSLQLYFEITVLSYLQIFTQCWKKCLNTRENIGPTYQIDSFAMPRGAQSRFNEFCWKESPCII
jgi:hypothetical protein